MKLFGFCIVRETTIRSAELQILTALYCARDEIIDRIKHHERHTMATEQEFRDHLAALKTAIITVLTAQSEKIAALTAAVEAGSTVTKEDLNELDAQTVEILNAVNAATPAPTEPTEGGPTS